MVCTNRGGFPTSKIIPMLQGGQTARVRVAFAFQGQVHQLELNLNDLDSLNVLRSNSIARRTGESTTYTAGSMRDEVEDG